MAANRFCDGSCVCCWDDTKGLPNTNVSEDPSAEGKQRIGYNGQKYIYHTCVAVPNRNSILLHRVFRAHHRVLMCFSGSSALQHVKLSDALEIRNRVIFDFYPGLPHVHVVTQ